MQVIATPFRVKIFSLNAIFCIKAHFLRKTKPRLSLVENFWYDSTKRGTFSCCIVVNFLIECEENSKF